MSLWGGRFAEETDRLMREFSSSIQIDSKMWAVDLKVSTAHTRMLAAQGILSAADGEKIVAGLEEIGAEIASGKWKFNPEAEDIHGEIEGRLFEKIGDAAKRMHTARSRNDQVVTDTRLYLKEHVEVLIDGIKELQQDLLLHAESHRETLLPGMTHLQHAQPVSLAHHLLAYFWMFQRDSARLQESLPRILSLPLGAAALAGTGFPLDRQRVARDLQFLEVAPNSLDAVSDRDFVIEFLANASICMMHLSRLCEELILWSAPEFAFIELGDAVTTGSSIMPQKKNPDAAELIRGRVGRVYGALMGSLTMMKALPLSYNRDMQEDKVHLFSGLETVTASVKLMSLMFKNIQWKTDNMAQALRGDFSNATDLADDLVEKGKTFREAHHIVGQLVQWCIKNGKILEDLSVEDLKAGGDPAFDKISAAKLAHKTVMAARRSEGGTSPEAVQLQLEKAKKVL
ncbi:MAG: argininosuccinate lyase [Bdellovibrionales bacterium]|nr:argininosuccinate lyase [Bdellovibrionales bacterium]